MKQIQKSSELLDDGNIGYGSTVKIGENTVTLLGQITIAFGTKNNSNELRVLHLHHGSTGKLWECDGKIVECFKKIEKILHKYDVIHKPESSEINKKD